MFSITPVVDLIKSSRPLQFVLVFIAGGAVAAVFYPTKQIKETITKKYEQQIQTIQQQNSQTLSTQQASYQKLQSEYSIYKVQTDSKINQLTTQVNDLKTHTKTTVVRTVHPDGTIEEHIVSENETESTEQISEQVQQEWQQKIDQSVANVTQEYDQKISTMTSQWSSKEEQYKQTISSLQESKTITTNPRKLGLEAGLLSNSDYYGHLTYDVWGPFFIGGQIDFGPNSAVGGGIGIRF